MEEKERIRRRMEAMEEEEVGKMDACEKHGRKLVFGPGRVK